MSLSARPFAQTVSNASSVLGALLASLICLGLQQVDPSLRSWPYIYVVVGGLGWLLIELGARRSALLFVADKPAFPLPAPALPAPPGSPLAFTKQLPSPPLSLRKLLAAIAYSSFSYATFYWVFTFIPSKAPVSETAYWKEQLSLMGLDSALLIAFGTLSKRFKPYNQVLVCMALCGFVSAVYGLGWMGESRAALLVLLLGVGGASCAIEYFTQLAHPEKLFSYSCLSAAIGSAIASSLLTISLWTRSAGLGEGLASTPFTLLFLLCLSLLVCLRSHPAPAELDGVGR